MPKVLYCLMSLSGHLLRPYGRGSRDGHSSSSSISPTLLVFRISCRKINTFTFYKGVCIAPRSQIKVKMEALCFYTKYYIPHAKIYPVMMWIQIRARGSGLFFIKMVQFGAFWPIINLKINNFKANFLQ